MKWTPSKDWTATDRLKTILIISDMIQTDIYAEKYGLAGRPNITSLQLVASASKEELNMDRASIEEMLKNEEMANNDGFASPFQWEAKEDHAAGVEIPKLPPEAFYIKREGGIFEVKYTVEQSMMYTDVEAIVFAKSILLAFEVTMNELSPTPDHIDSIRISEIGDQKSVENFAKYNNVFISRRIRMKSSPTELL